MPDTIDILSNISKLSKDEIKSIWEKVKSNGKLLDSCAKHNFQPIENRRYKCTNCNGELDSINVSWYNTGLEHGTKQ